MARIRTIKPSFWGSASLATVSRDARLLMVGLISFADDEGRFLASSSAITGYVYPHDEVSPTRLRKWLNELESRELIGLYEIDGLRYGFLPKFRTHQRISHPQTSAIPAPQGGLFDD